MELHAKLVIRIDNVENFHATFLQEIGCSKNPSLKKIILNQIDNPTNLYEEIIMFLTPQKQDQYLCQYFCIFLIFLITCVC